VTSDEIRSKNNAFLRKLWATGHCDTALQTEAALLLDELAREIQRLKGPSENQSHVARGMCQLSNRPACSEYPRCQCGQTLAPSLQGGPDLRPLA
jgi:hypothetical protein